MTTDDIASINWRMLALRQFLEEKIDIRAS